jgi:hypothetical protein
MVFDYLPIDPDHNPDQPTFAERIINIAGMIAGSILFAALVYGVVLFVCLVL